MWYHSTKLISIGNEGNHKTEPCLQKIDKGKMVKEDDLITSRGIINRILLVDNRLKEGIVLILCKKVVVCKQPQNFKQSGEL